MLTASFKELRMKDYESLNEFNAKMNDTVNSSLNLSNKIPKTLPKRFQLKVTLIETSEVLHNMGIEELVGSLLTHEYTFPQTKKNKYIVFKTDREDPNNRFPNIQ